MELAAWLWTYDSRFIFGMKHTCRKLQNAWVVSLLISSTLSFMAFAEVNSQLFEDVGLGRRLRAVGNDAPVCHDARLATQIHVYLILQAINVPLVAIMSCRIICELKSARQYYNLLQT